MVKTSSTMLPLGTLLPFFDLPLVKVERLEEDAFFEDLDRFTRDMLDARPLLVMILCAHCPFVKHLERELTRLEKDFAQTIQILGVSSNCIETHPEDGPEYLIKQIIQNQWNFPYVIDREQTFAKALKAACTPDFFLFASVQSNKKKELVYRGQFDDSRPNNNICPSGSDLRGALNAVLNFQKVSIDQKPSIGCNIKWKKGAAPLWFG